MHRQINLKITMTLLSFSNREMQYKAQTAKEHRSVLFVREDFLCSL